MVRAGAFQGAGRGMDGCAGGEHVVQEQNARRGAGSFPRKKGAFHVPEPLFPMKSGLRNSPGPAEKDERVAAPPQGSGQLRSDESGKVEPASEIFQGVDRDRDDRGRDRVRKEVFPAVLKRFRQSLRHRPRRKRAAGIFRCHDGGADVSRVLEEGAGFAVRKIAGGKGAVGRTDRGPSGDGTGGQLRERGRQEFPEGEGVFQDRPEETREAARLFSARSPGRRTPCCRDRWRTRSTRRSRGIGGPT